MNAFDELSRYGEIGVLTYDLFLDRVRREVRRRGYPSPRRGGTWSEDDYAEAVHELVLQRPDLTISLLATADQNALTALVTTIVRNFLIDQVKASDVGKLNGRLKTLMSADPRFVVDPGDRWALVAGPRAASMVGDSELEAAAWNPRGLTLGELPPAGPTPAAERTTLLTVVEAILTAAHGSVSGIGLARAVARRFALATPTHTELPDPASPCDQNRHLAKPVGALLDALDDAERTAITASARAGTTTAVAEALHCGRRRADAILQRAITKIRATVAVEDLDADDLLATIDALEQASAQPAPDRSSDTDVNPTNTTEPDRRR